MSNDLTIQKTRSSREILSDTLRFMSVRARDLVFAIFVFAMPFILTSSVVSFYMIDSPSAPDLYDLLIFRKALDKNLFILLCFAFIIKILGMFVFNLGINKVMLKPITDNKEDNFLNHFKNEISEGVKNYLFSFLIVLTVYSVIIKATTYLSQQFPVEPGLETFLLLLPVYFVMSACLYVGFAILYLCARDGLDVAGAAQKTWHYTTARPKKAWGTAFLILLVVVLMNKIIQVLFFQFISLIFMQGLSSALLLVTGLIQTSTIAIVVIFYNIAAVFLLGSLEDEVDGHYIKSKIENI